MDNVVQTLETLRAIDHAGLDYEIRKLQAIKDWALDNLGVNYRAGDRVRLTQDIPCLGGWLPYQECLVEGATGTVKRIDFGIHKQRWFAEFTPDREWKIWFHPPGVIHRIWQGKLEDLPEGMESMGEYNLKNYPDGKHHVFMFDLAWMTKAE